MSNRIYLGDSVYATFDLAGGVTLTTDNGYGPSNTIILESAILAALIRLAERRYDSTDPNACSDCYLVLAKRGVEHECDGDNRILG